MGALSLSLPDAIATQALGHHWGRLLPVGTVLLLSGDLGSGKTTFVQGLGAGLGITDAIDSPTFTLINEYTTGRVPLYHLDLYRLEPAEVSSLYLETYWIGDEYPLGIVAIEWAERLPDLPPDYLQVNLTYTPEGGRSLQVTPYGNVDPELLLALAGRNLQSLEQG